MAHEIFWAFRTKKPRPIFSTFDPQKMVQFLTFLKFSQKGAKYKRAPCTQRILVVDPTLRWGRFSPLSPKLFKEVKQIFDISATFGVRTAKTVRCIRTNFSGFIDIREVNKSPYFFTTRHKLLKIQTLRRKVSHSQFSTVVQSWNWTCTWYNTHRLFFTQGTEGEHAA